MEGVKARQAVGVRPFKLDRACASQPARFEFEFRHQSRNYWYGFEVDASKVHSEWLYELKKTTQALIFERTTPNGDETRVEFGSLPVSSKKERDFLDFVARGTRPNQLFLRESIERNARLLDEIYQWFEKVLVIIFPETHYELNLDVQAEKTQAIVQYLQEFDTGVSGFSLQPIIPESEIPPAILQEITGQLQSGGALHFMSIFQTSPNRYLVSKDEHQELVVFKLMLKHRMLDSDNEALFDVEEESDGTVRLMDLIPILLLGGQENRVFVIDELDRSLHPNLCYRLIEKFLSQSNPNSQVIVTTHETNLLDLELLRRDEIWFIEKDEHGASHAYSLEEFAPRYDKDIQKGYLSGRFGAIPFLGKQRF